MWPSYGGWSDKVTWALPRKKTATYYDAPFTLHHVDGQPAHPTPQGMGSFCDTTCLPNGLFLNGHVCHVHLRYMGEHRHAWMFMGSSPSFVSKLHGGEFLKMLKKRLLFSPRGQVRVLSPFFFNEIPAEILCKRLRVKDVKQAHAISTGDMP